MLFIHLWMDMIANKRSVGPRTQYLAIGPKSDHVAPYQPESEPQQPNNGPQWLIRDEGSECRSSVRPVSLRGPKLSLRCRSVSLRCRSVSLRGPGCRSVVAPGAWVVAPVSVVSLQGLGSIITSHASIVSPQITISSPSHHLSTIYRSPITIISYVVILF